MLQAALIISLIAYVPGAVIFRLPLVNRRNRSLLPAEERLFWSITLSVAFSSCVALLLATLSAYSIELILWINGLASLALIVASKCNLRLDTQTPLLTRTALAPSILIFISVVMFFFVPPAEYVIGGRDPGVYINEGIQITQRGSLVNTDSVIRPIPPDFKNLFFPTSQNPGYDMNLGYDSVRFMGFFIVDPDAGTVVGQFPHLYPAWVAIAYDTHGLTGARYISGLWAIFGVIAVYFAGATLIGRPAAFAGATLLAVHVAQVWYARYPNSEVVMQALTFAGLFAYFRAHVDGQRFFAPLAALLIGLTYAAHFTGGLVIAAVMAATICGRCDRQPLLPSFTIPLALVTAVISSYYLTVLTPYMARPLRFFMLLEPFHIFLIVLAAILTLVTGIAIRRERVASRLRTWLPVLLTTVMCVLAVYAVFFREAGGHLAQHDADGLRTYMNFYVLPVGLAAALVGWIMVSKERFWQSSALLFVAATFSIFIFYKARVFPEHFWMARRFVPVILPASLLLIGAAAFLQPFKRKRTSSADQSITLLRRLRLVVGAALIVIIGWQYVGNTLPILRHVEFAGLIPKLEEIADRFTSTDLLLVESRGASDMHVLATPLDYIYARNTLVFNSTNPNKGVFSSFLDWARLHYDRIFFIGSGGTDLLSRRVTVRPISDDRFQIPEYEAALNQYPTEIRSKEFDYSIYEFVEEPTPPGAFDLDVGTNDDLYVRRIHAKQRDLNNVSYRWTRDRSYVSILGTTPDARTLTLRMSSGGRPPEDTLVTVRLTLNEYDLGEFSVGNGFENYTVTMTEHLAETIALEDEASILQIESSPWIPSQILGVSDDRDLGVMLDRVEVR